MPLTRLPLQDSPAHAERCQRLLDLPRDYARNIAFETCRVLEAGAYDAELPSGARARVELGARIAQERARKVSLAPTDPLDRVAREHLGVSLEEARAPRAAETRVWVSNEPSLTAARAFAARGGRPCVLNFANGATPGGGFLTGSRAQEESLCFASTLYSSIKGDPMYALHRRRADHSSSAHLILSTATAIRDEEQRFIPAPWEMTVLTCAAPVCDTRTPRAPHLVTPAQGALLMRERVERVLDVAAAAGCTHLVLGAWGCGAFRNDPVEVARLFEEALEARAGAFEEVVFAISDWSEERRFLAPFARRFSAGASS